MHKKTFIWNIIFCALNTLTMLLFCMEVPQQIDLSEEKIQNPKLLPPSYDINYSQLSEAYNKLSEQCTELINSVNALLDLYDAKETTVKTSLAADIIEDIKIPEIENLKKELNIAIKRNEMLEQTLSLKAAIDPNLRTVRMLNNNIIKYNEEINDLKTNIDTIKSNNTTAIAHHKQEIKKLETQIGNQAKDIVQYKEEITNLNTQINTIKSNNTTTINDHKQEISNLEVQITNQEKKLLNAKEELKNNNLEIEKKKKDITAPQETIVLLQEKIKKLSDQNILYQLEKNNLKTKLKEYTLSREFPNPNYNNEPLTEYLSRHESLNKHPENNTELKKLNQFEHTSIPTKQLILAVSGGWLIGIIMCFLYYNQKYVNQKIEYYSSSFSGL